ncbi:hypothetical protein [uncultured Duncaniella sp.]|uniref:hypothetical protein n=1 Tax=uncultured Duncaniella sp. TaxID=2768039 RepID=UPI002648CC17|nr:hypothetical protein [uncultured Duncaniella sp.]
MKSGIAQNGISQEVGVMHTDDWQWNGKVKAASPMLTSEPLTIIGVCRPISDESGVR